MNTPDTKLGMHDSLIIAQIISQKRVDINDAKQ